MNDPKNNPCKVIARIHWIPATEGGRKHPPVGPRYSTVVKFEHEAEQWPQVAWSIVADFKNEFRTEAEINFLSPDAPLHLLEPDNKFELYEGRRLIARGEALKEQIEQPSKMTRIHATAELQAQ